MNWGVDLWKKRIRLASQFDHKGGYTLLNGSQRIRCQNRNNCREAIDPTTPLKLQARAAAVRSHPSRTQYGFMEDAAFTKWREASITFNMPENWAARFQARRMSLTFSGRNLKTWTDYTGIDPEANYFSTTNLDSSNNNFVNDFQTQAPQTYYIMRLTLGF